MLSVVSNVRVFVCQDATDMRCGRHRLAAKVRDVVHQDPLSGHLFLFFNKRHTSVKVLYFDKSGYAIWHKVLERGTFAIPSQSELDRVELACVLDGVEIANISRRQRFFLPQQA